MKRIAVTPNASAIVDDELFSPLSAMGAWNLSGRGYASCYVRGSGSKTPKRLFMHHAVLRLLGRPSPEQIDHHNGNKLDNRAANLRPATNSQNNANRPRQSNNKSGFRGVSRVFRAAGPRWRAEICKQGAKQHLGWFPTPQEAAHKYDKAARRLFGEFAFLNFHTRQGEPIVAEPVDFLGREIKTNDTIVYPLRKGASLWLKKLRITSVTPERASGYNTSGRLVHVKNFKNVVVVPEPQP
jgi:hypothetical protein